MEWITSKENGAVKEFCKLYASKKQRDQTRTFALESHKLLREALQNDVSIEKVFMTPFAEEKYGEELFELLNRDVPVLRIADAVSRKMSVAETPQGVFAICRKPERTFTSIKANADGVYLALCNLQDPGNIGTILRTADALGVQGVLISADSCDIYNPKVLRASMGTVFRLPVFVCDDIGADLQRLSKAGLLTYAAVVTPDARPLTEISFAQKGVAVIGNEGNGLPANLVACCDERMTIPMAGNAESLNAAMAAGIILWQMTLSTKTK